MTISRTWKSWTPLGRCHGGLHVCILLPCLGQEGQHWFSVQTPTRGFLVCMSPTRKHDCLFPQQLSPNYLNTTLSLPAASWELTAKPCVTRREKKKKSTEKFSNIQSRVSQQAQRPEQPVCQEQLLEKCITELSIRSETKPRDSDEQKDILPK